MKEFDELLAISDRLLAPDGCPWDLEQTIDSLQPYLLEETHELIEAIDLKSFPKIAEELGDVIYSLIFIAKVAKKESGSEILSTALRQTAEKLIRRHPHIFAEVKIESTDDVIQNWESIKKKEGKKSPIDGIPPTLPALARAQKVIHKLRRAKSSVADLPMGDNDLERRLWECVRDADARGVDAESVLRRLSLACERKFNAVGGE